MRYLGRVAGIAALALGTTALSGCYAPPPPPPVAAVAPAQPMPPYPPSAYPSAAAVTPTPLTTPDSGYPDSGYADLGYAASGYPASGYYGSTTAPVMAPSNAGTTSIIAPYAPPPMRVETRPPAPSPLAMWQPGHWTWNGSQFVWTQGQYVERPSPTANWLPGYWQQGSGGWTWIDGHWAG